MPEVGGSKCARWTAAFCFFLVAILIAASIGVLDWLSVRQSSQYKPGDERWDVSTEAMFEELGDRRWINNQTSIIYEQRFSIHGRVMEAYSLTFSWVLKDQGKRAFVGFHKCDQQIVSDVWTKKVDLSCQSSWKSVGDDKKYTFVKDWGDIVCDVFCAYQQEGIDQQIITDRISDNPEAFFKNYQKVKDGLSFNDFMTACDDIRGVGFSQKNIQTVFSVWDDLNTEVVSDPDDDKLTLDELKKVSGGLLTCQNLQKYADKYEISDPAGPWNYLAICTAPKGIIAVLTLALVSSVIGILASVCCTTRPKLLIVPSFLTSVLSALTAIAYGASVANSYPWKALELDKLAQMTYGADASTSDVATVRSGFALAIVASVVSFFASLQLIYHLYFVKVSSSRGPGQELSVMSAVPVTDVLGAPIAQRGFF